MCGRLSVPAAVHTVKLGVVAVLVAALLVEAHLELDLPERAEVLGSADPAVAVGIVVQEAIEGRWELGSVEVPIACIGIGSAPPLPHQSGSQRAPQVCGGAGPGFPDPKKLPLKQELRPGAQSGVSSECRGQKMLQTVLL